MTQRYNHFLDRRFASVRLATCAVVAAAAMASAAYGVVLPTADGFYGIWYSNQASGDQYVYKYSGGLGTYPQQTAPIAFYSADVDRTYFLYGGTNGNGNTLKNYISYYDHATGLLARPREVRHVGGSDVHRNATLAIDDDGYLWVFGNSHGNSGSGDLYRSTNPHDITDMVHVGLPGSIFNNNAGQVKLAYSSPIYVPSQGMLVTYNQYDDGRSVHAASATVTAGAIEWIDDKRLIKIGGQYEIARRNGDTVAVAANYHPGGLNHRTNLYYLETSDLSQSWSTVDGAPIVGTLTTAINPALVHNYQAEQRLVYLKDINWDADGRPILLYLTVSDATGTGYRSGPQPGERTLHVAHWSGSQWNIRDVLQTKHNYNHGELYVEPDGTWRVIGPFLDGPQVYGTGGEVGVWTSQDQGVNWQLEQQLTQNSQFNHTYVRRPVNAHEDFYAYWADGNPFAQSASRLYFATKSGEVYRMPTQFTGDFALPVPMSEWNDPDPDPDPDPPAGALRVYEGFHYDPTAGTALVGKAGGFGWAGPWQFSGTGAQGEFTVLVDSLSSSVYPVATQGGSARAVGPGPGIANNVRLDRPLAEPFSMAEDGVLYASFLFRKDVSDPSNPTGGNNMELDLGANTIRIGSTSSDQWFLNDASASFGTVTLGQTYFIVVKVEASASSSDMRSVLIFDPSRTVPANEPEEWDQTAMFNSSAVLDQVRLWIGIRAAGVFDEIRLGSTWESVTVMSPHQLPGDFNGDGRVDAADYVVWRKNGGTPQQYEQWRANFGATAAGAAAVGQAAVPEPTIWPILLTTLFVLPRAYFGLRRPAVPVSTRICHLDSLGEGQ